MTLFDLLVVMSARPFTGSKSTYQATFSSHPYWRVSLAAHVLSLLLAAPPHYGPLYALAIELENEAWKLQALERSQMDSADPE